MFDPTVFDNLKTVLEGAVYEYDLEGGFQITDRHDQVDLAHLSRHYSLTFQNTDSTVSGTIHLTNPETSWTGEILENNEQALGCQLNLAFVLPVTDIESQCSALRFQMNKLWRHYKAQISQDISYTYSQPDPSFTNTIRIHLPDDIDESFIMDIPGLIQLLHQTLHTLESFA